MNSFYQKSLRLILGTLVVYALLVSTHLGEFWPFSIYPMFSQGGRPWVRSVVREVPGRPSATRWEPTSQQSLPGLPFRLEEAGINQNDIANFVSKSSTWNAQRVAAMRKVFGAVLAEKNLLILRADGRINDGETVEVIYTPFLLLAEDSTYFNPRLSLSTD